MCCSYLLFLDFRSISRYDDNNILFHKEGDFIVFVIKRNGKKVPFDGTKIAIAIKKGFDSILVDNANYQVPKYFPEDCNLVYHAVIAKIQDAKQEKIKIEEIQDFIEQELKNHGYQDVYESFSKYRLTRSQSRESFVDEKKLHKFLKSLENLGLRSTSEEFQRKVESNMNINCSMGTLYEFGSTVTREFSKAYLMKKDYADAHDSGDIHIHDLDYMPMGTTTTCQIELSKLFSNGFHSNYGFLKEPQDITAYSDWATMIIQLNQNDQHGGQSIPAFDFDMAPGVLKTFKTQFQNDLFNLLAYSNFEKFVAINSIEREINKLNSIDFDISLFYKYSRNAEEVERLFRYAYDSAYRKTNQLTYQAMESFLDRMNTMHSRAGAQVPFSTVNFGTDTSPEGRMITKNFLLAAQHGLGKKEPAIYPVSIFKVKDGINYQPSDPNYDLFQLACRVSAKRLLPNFSFLDATFNRAFLQEGNTNTEIAYVGCGTRVIDNFVSQDKSVVGSRGNLSFTSINLPRLGIKYGKYGCVKTDLEGFFQDLEGKMEFVKNQLVDRFEIQGNKHVYNFPTLMGNSVWMDSEKLKPEDKIRKVLKQGTLSIGFIGLAECLKALTGKHHGESSKSQELGLKIIQFMRQKTDEFSQKYNLNFTLIATPAENLSGRFTSIDQAIFGSIPGVTDRDYYTNSFHIPVYFDISVQKKIQLEAPYHALTNGGHFTYVELEDDVFDNEENFEKVIRLMKESNIGYGSVNHGIDRDPVCGYVGIIHDICPGCGRKETTASPFERIRKITSYLVGNTNCWCNPKLAELNDRIPNKFEDDG